MKLKRDVSDECQKQRYLEDILTSISQVIICLDEKGKLKSINSPEKLGLTENVERYKNEHYSQWIAKNNPQMKADLDRCFKYRDPYIIKNTKFCIDEDNVYDVDYQIIPFSEPPQVGGVLLVIDIQTLETRSINILSRYTFGKDKII
jgi:transcriptional regulator with PAS, ATPase and Fis domain